MSDEELRPRLRPVELMPVQAEGRELVALHDPDRYAQDTAVVAPEALPLLGLFDGTRTLRDMQVELMRHGASLIPMETLEELTSSLDRCLLLDNERFRQTRAERERAFAEQPVRAAAHAGSAYPAQAEDARAFLDGITGPVEPAPEGVLRRLIAPHIDLRLGAEVHGAAGAALRAAGRPDVVVVLGVCHAACEHNFIACRKDFETPFGLVPHDGAFLDRLEARLGADVTTGQIVHQAEHSVEFQALWLAHLWPDDPPALVPFLVGSFHEHILAGTDPGKDDDVARFCEALRATIAEDGRRVLVLASVDLSHMGPRYGHDEGLDEAAEGRLAREDEDVLERMLAGDAEGFFRSVARDENARNVCGVAPIYVTLKVGEGTGRLLRYGQGRIDPESGSVVSYAAMAFEE